MRFFKFFFILGMPQKSLEKKQKFFHHLADLLKWLHRQRWISSTLSVCVCVCLCSKTKLNFSSSQPPTFLGHPTHSSLNIIWLIHLHFHERNFLHILLRKIFFLIFILVERERERRKIYWTKWPSGNFFSRFLKWGKIFLVFLLSQQRQQKPFLA